nr:MAG: replication associated protein [Cressdnaviricota sp.]
MDLSDKDYDYMSNHNQSKSLSSRNFVLTSFLKEDCDKLKENSLVTYFCYAEEICPSTKRLHYQGYVEFSKPVSFKSLKLLKTWFMTRKGSQDQAILYCSGPYENNKMNKSKPKNDTFVEFGVRSKQGTRSDLKGSRKNVKGESVTSDCHTEIITDIKNGMSEHDLGLKYFEFFRLHTQAFKHAIKLYSVQKKRSWKMNVVVNYGASSTGKTYNLYERFGNNKEDVYLSTNIYVFNKPQKNGPMWFTGYDPDVHDTIFMDEFNGSWMTIQDFNLLCDRAPMQVRVHNGMVPFLAKNIVITSNSPVYDWWEYNSKTASSLDGVARRITETHCFVERRPEVNDSVTFNQLKVKDIGEMSEKGWTYGEKSKKMKCVEKDNKLIFSTSDED